MRKNQSGFTLVELIEMTIGKSVILGLMITGFWVLTHFIAKFW